ncbi:MAG: hypothetical protein H0Z28_09290 [Archaeoglobus sp.]|nr:hypothetical protein [Archaeoglobus sp.]
MIKNWKLTALIALIAIMLIQTGVAQQPQYPSAKLFASHADGSREDCYSSGEKVYVNGHFWPCGEVKYIITDSEGDWRDLIECYEGNQTACNELPSGGVNALHNGIVDADVPVTNQGHLGTCNVSNVYTGWNIPDPNKHYRLLAWNETHWNPQNRDAGSNDSFGCTQEIPEFPLILLPAGILLGFFYWKRKGSDR